MTMRVSIADAPILEDVEARKGAGTLGMTFLLQTDRDVIFIYGGGGGGGESWRGLV